MIKKSFYIISVILFINLFYLSPAKANREKRYMPYPIIFVSGIGTGSQPGANGYPSATWDYFIRSFDDNFLDTTAGIGGDASHAKYFLKGENVHLQFGETVHLHFLSYDSSNKIEDNASLLSKKINNILKEYYPPQYEYVEPCANGKVILITHSMGGLIARYMLVHNQDIREKVARVICLGTPHLGAPIANIIYFLQKELDILSGKINKLEGEINKTIEKRRREELSGLKELLESKKKGNIDFCTFILNYINVHADGKSIEEMLIPKSNANSYIHSFSKGSLSWPSEVPPYDANKTFLANLDRRLDVPITLFAGTGTGLRNAICSGLNVKIGLENFDRDDYSCIHNGYYEDGDGIVNLASQQMASSNVKDGTKRIETNANHSTVELPIYNLNGTSYQLYTGHYDHSVTKDEIFQEIDDPPEVVSIRAIPKYWMPQNQTQAEQYYVIVGCKEYLLADVEVIELLLDGEDIDPFVESKPYNEYGKEFLKEREVQEIKDENGDPTKLKPGEFYVLAKIPTGVHTLRVRLRNPAQKIKEEETGVPQGSKPVVVRFSRPKVEGVEFVNSKGSDFAWTVDVDTLDEEEPPDYKDNIGNSGSLSFTVESELFQDIVLGVEIYDFVQNSAEAGPRNIMKTLIDNRTVNLNRVGNDIYKDNFPSGDITQSDLTWDGKMGNGEYVLEENNYPVRIMVHSQDQSGMEPPFNPNNSSGRQGLSGSNWDDSSGFWNDLIFTDPTFVQYSRGKDLSLGLKLKMELLGVRIKSEYSPNQIWQCKGKFRVYLTENFIPILEKLVYIEGYYLQMRQFLMTLVERNDIDIKIAEWIFKLINYNRQKMINQIKERIRLFSKEINQNISDIIFNEIALQIKYKHSPSSTPVIIDIHERED